MGARAEYRRQSQHMCDEVVCWLMGMTLGRRSSGGTERKRKIYNDLEGS